MKILSIFTGKFLLFLLLGYVRTYFACITILSLFIKMCLIKLKVLLLFR